LTCRRFRADPRRPLSARGTRHHFAARGSGRSKRELCLRRTSGRACTDSSKRGTREGFGDRADPSRGPRAKQWRPGAQTHRQISLGLAQTEWPKATSAEPPPVFARPSASDRLLGRLPRQGLDYFPAFTARDRLSVWIGDDHIRSFGRKEDRNFALLHVEPHHGTPPTEVWPRRIRLRRYRRTDRQARGTRRSQGAAS
jgi:hypothetical protein